MAAATQILNLIAQIHRSNKLSVKKQADLLDQHQLSPLDWAILHSLHIKPVQSQAEVARSISRAPSNVRTPIEILEKRVLVSRQQDHHDRRVNNTLLSEEGSVLVEKLLPSFEADHKKLLQGFSAQDQKELERLLKLMLNNQKKK